MNPVETVFRTLSSQGQKAFVPFITAGDPDLTLTERILPALGAAGASIIEVGIPFSDPIADGPVIQASYTRALGNGFRLADCFEMTGRVTSQPGGQTPLVAMGSYSLIVRRGAERFIAEAQRAGFAGAVVPDLPVEESDDFARVCRDRDFALTLLVTPTTAPERAERIVNACTGFVYVVSVVGITGERAALSDQLGTLISRLRQQTDRPLCIGFGISRPEQARDLKHLADGIIVGSALVKKLEAAQPPDRRDAAVKQLVEMTAEFRRVLDE